MYEAADVSNLLINAVVDELFNVAHPNRFALENDRELWRMGALIVNLLESIVILISW